jgi:hypothetical protein
VVSPQQEADRDLAKWQDLKKQYPDPEERLLALMTSFFRPPPPCDVEYSAIERTLMEIMSDAQA